MPVAVVLGLIVFAVVLVFNSNEATQNTLTIVVGLLVTTIPSVIAAGYSERASRDLRNGVVGTAVTDALDSRTASTITQDEELTGRRGAEARAPSPTPAPTPEGDTP